MSTLDTILAILALGFVVCIAWLLITVILEDNK